MSLDVPVVGYLKLCSRQKETHRSVDNYSKANLGQRTWHPFLSGQDRQAAAPLVAKT